VNYYVIGDEDSVLGFALAGVRGRTATTEQEVRDAFQSVLKDTDVGIIIMTEPAADTIRSTVDRYTFTSEFPLILEIPDRNGPSTDRPDVRTLVNQAIGINL
jgi:V/A-type H+/Na+-transporting ATPase subunit F